MLTVSMVTWTSKHYGYCEHLSMLTVSSRSLLVSSINTRPALAFPFSGLLIAWDRAAALSHGEHDFSKLISSTAVMQGPPLEPGQWPTPGPDLWSEAAHPQPWPGCRGSSWGSWYINAVLLSWHPLRLRHWCKPDWVVLCPSVTQSLCTLSISFSNTTFPYEQKMLWK